MTNKHDKQKARWFESWPFLILVCVVLPIAFRSFFYSPYHIPSGSMKNTLLIGDFIIVDKSAYGYSRYSFPFAPPIFKGRKNAAYPKRGDIVVFRPVPQDNTDFIKRIIGLPGDRVQMKNNQLFLNGQAVKKREINTITEMVHGAGPKKFIQLVETLPRKDGSTISYETLDMTPYGQLDNTKEYTVPEGHYFLMGDNRDQSADSRTRGVGFVPFENLVGRADYIALSTSGYLWQFWTWLETIRGERFWTPTQYEARQKAMAN